MTPLVVGIIIAVFGSLITLILRHVFFMPVFQLRKTIAKVPAELKFYGQFIANPLLGMDKLSEGRSACSVRLRELSCDLSKDVASVAAYPIARGLGLLKQTQEELGQASSKLMYLSNGVVVQQNADPQHLMIVAGEIERTLRVKGGVFEPVLKHRESGGPEK